jgi:hypothetical protein
MNQPRIYKIVPYRHGLKWNNSEIEELFSNLRQNISIEEIAKRHHRTVGAIKKKITRTIKDSPY